MPRDLRTHLCDILQCIDAIDLYVANQTFADYEANRMVRSAVEREFITIAEAMIRISRISPELGNRVEHVRDIADFRNIIVHAYEDVNDTYVWRVVKESVPPLKQQIETWLAELDARQP